MREGCPMATIKTDIYLSVISPAYNEQAWIADSLYPVTDYLAKQVYRSEIVVVDDGSY